MPQLRHLVFDVPYVLQPFPENQPELPNLQTLSLVYPGKGSRIVKIVPNVKRLGIVLHRKSLFHFYNLNDLNQLEKLKVISMSEISPSRLSQLLLPRTLKKLTLVEETRFSLWRNMYMIGSLPNLQVLKLHYDCRDAVGAETWKTTDEEFPQLKYLLIDGSDALLEWITQSNPLPRLKCLVIRSCKRLKKIPQDIREIQSLELIEVDQYCRKSLVQSAKKIKEYRESNGNYSLQLRLPPDQLLEERDELPSNEEQQYAERTVANLFHGILEKTKVMRDKVVRMFY